MSSSSSPNTAVMDAAFGADPFDSLELDVPAARVRLRPHAEDDRVHVRGFVPNADLESARTIFDRKGISTHQSGDSLHVFGESLSATVDDWRWRYRYQAEVHLDLYLPANLEVLARVPGGIVDAAGLEGRAELTVMGGSVTVERLKGPLRVRGSGDSLSVHEHTGSSLDLEWSAGSVSLQQIESDETTLRARAAPTTLRDIRGAGKFSVHAASLDAQNVDGPCEAQVHGGSLTFRGTPTHDVSLTAVGGPLQTHLPPDCAAELTLLGNQVALDNAFAFHGEETPQRIEGRLNGGGPRLRFRAVRGTAACRSQ